MPLKNASTFVPLTSEIRRFSGHMGSFHGHVGAVMQPPRADLAEEA
jgi:hypothetical protein